jgi:hypothetical protein
LGSHVRDVLDIFAERIELALVEDGPEFGWWDHEAAVIDLHDNEQRPSAVADAITANVERLADLISRADDASWLRTATRRSDEHFTVEDLARFALHESVHPRQDAERSADDAALPARRSVAPSLSEKPWLSEKPGRTSTLSEELWHHRRPVSSQVVGGRPRLGKG